MISIFREVSHFAMFSHILALTELSSRYLKNDSHDKPTRQPLDRAEHMRCRVNIINSNITNNYSDATLRIKVNITKIEHIDRVRWESDKIAISAMRDCFPITRIKYNLFPRNH